MELELIDVLLDAAGYLDSHHDAEAVRLRARLREQAERVFLKACVPEVCEMGPQPLPMVGPPPSRRHLHQEPWRTAYFGEPVNAIGG